MSCRVESNRTEQLRSSVPQRQPSDSHHQHFSQSVSPRISMNPTQTANMPTKYDDEYEQYNFDHDKYIFSGHSGKQRTKREVNEHTNHADPCGHSRKLLTKLMNTEANHKRVDAAEIKK